MNKIPEITLLTEEQFSLAGELLERAFSSDPLSVYTAPDPDTRKRIFLWYFTQFVQAEFAMGNVYTTADQPLGIAVWMPPQTENTASEQKERNVPDEIDRYFGLDAYQRFTGAFQYFEQVHHHVLTEPHWYLELLGVAPQSQGQGIGKALLAPVLQKADEEGFACYLETFTARNVPFYEQNGFRVAEAGIEPQSKLAFWAMKREPQQ